MTDSTAPAPWVPTQDDIDTWGREQAAAIALIGPLLPACPGWCREQHETPHFVDIDRTDDGRHQLTRFHRMPLVDLPHLPPEDGVPLDDVQVVIEQMEHTDANGAVTRHPAAVVLAHSDGVDLSANIAVRLAAALLTARDVLAEIA